MECVVVCFYFKQKEAYEMRISDWISDVCSSDLYHRKGATILDMHHAYDGPADAFRPIAAKHHAAYLLVCPGFPEGTIYQARSPRGFYAGLMRGDVPGWLRPVPLDRKSTRLNSSH